MGSHASRALEGYGVVGGIRVVDRVGYVIPIGRGQLADPDAMPIRTSCAHCGAAFDGTLGVGRQWFAQHRQQVHPELDAPAPRRRQRRVWK